MNVKYRVLGVTAALALAATACGSKPSTTAGGGGNGGGGSSSSASSGGSAQQVSGCLVTDTGGIDDRSFNASAWQGMLNAQQDIGAKVKYLQSQSQNDYTPNINQFVNQGCSLIVTVGFLMGDATQQAAKQYPNQKFAIIDYAYDKPISNVKSLTFSTDQAAFLGGYLAAGMTKSGKVGTFGGSKIPPVTIYMDGFTRGVQYYNQKNHKSVKVLGWNTSSQNGLFTGDFTDQGKGKAFAQNLMQQGADIIFPVAGSVGLGAAAAVQQAGGNNRLIWVDTDGCKSAAQYCSLFLTSVVKNISTAVDTVMKQVAKNSFNGSQGYVGTLKNGGVGLAPYHDYANKVPSSLQSQINQLKQNIVSGKVKVSSS